ncbi:Acetyltransferase YpeA [Salinivirga cyanobacteriivorans]|uniref:Acetyltransferase YpeA n=1 Tax=Salinivirga cyanobacteriivorans TaxID=1307839 RepID=A0A0S2I3S1_9BACT|nr:GNAT family N-acetyltransferase [Salinivirga cyanobacteriivorans]ALO17006.1 Acetyltransferase YpeA [Salinivirga cyanobacteriivorans]
MLSSEILSYLPGDFNEISKFWNKLGLGGAERGDDEQVIERTINHGGAFFVMRVGNRLIGTAWITSDHRRLYLHHMGIHPEYQNQQLGYKLLEHCIQWSEKQGLQLKLEVHQSNKGAVHLYKKAGFKRLGDYDVYIIRDYKELPAK